MVKIIGDDDLTRRQIKRVARTTVRFAVIAQASRLVPVLEIEVFGSRQHMMRSPSVNESLLQK